MLLRKLLRDFRSHLGANLAAGFVIAIGIMIFVAFTMIMENLQLSRDTFYQQGRFPDGYADVMSAPASVVNDLLRVPGITEAAARMSQDVMIADEFGSDIDETRYIRLVSAETSLGTYALMSGKAPDAGRNEVVVDPKFAEAHKLRAGDIIPVVQSGTRQELTVSGVGRSPEMIYAVRDMADIYPNPDTFGVGFCDSETIRRLTGKTGYTEFIYAIQPGTDTETLKQNVESVMKPYGLIANYLQDKQLSFIMLKAELTQLRGSSVVMPFIFMMVAAMILFIMIRRMVQQQRTQIGVLKALGCSDRKIFLHYLQYAMIVCLFGGILGNLMALLIYRPLMNMYRQFYNMPFIGGAWSPRLVLLSLLLCAGLGAVAGFSASRAAAKLPPAEGMREKAPDKGSAGFLEKLTLFMNLFTSAGKMGLRNIVRNRMRSVFVCLGILITFALMVVPISFMLQTDQMVRDIFHNVERYQIRIYMNNIRPLADVNQEMAQFNEIQVAEGLLELSGTLSNQSLEESLPVVGIEPASQLYTPQIDDRAVDPEPGSIVLPENTANKLNVKVGDEIWLESPYFRNKEDQVRLWVSGIVQSSFSSGAYMNLPYLSNLTGNAPLTNNVLINAPLGTVAKLKEHFSGSEVVGGIYDSRDLLARFHEMIANSMTSMYIMFFFTMAMGFAIIYNSYVIILSERQREFASMMVLGMREREVLGIVKLEQWLITALAIPLGIPVAHALIQAIASASSSDNMTFRIGVDPLAVLIAAALTFVSIRIAQIVASRKVHTIKLAEALKSVE